MRTCRKKSESLVLIVIGVVLALNSTYPIRSVLAQQPAGQEEGGGRVIRQQKEEFGEITPKEKAEQMKQVGEEVGETGVVTPKASEAEGAGRVTRQQQAPPPSEAAKGSITPYGRVELDAIYSNRNMNPLDPGQFNGYATAAGQSSNSSSTLNPRYSVLGIRAARTDDVHTLKGVVEIDFYGQTDNAGNLPPRLRLANASYAYKRTSLTVGQDWTPVMALHPDLIDFSIMGYGGNLWQRLPQITVRHGFTDNIEGLLTVFRFERGLSAINPYTQRQPFTGHGAGAFSGQCSGQPSFFTCSENAFNDPVKMPYAGARLAYGGTGSLQGVSVAVSAAYRYYRSAPVSPGATSLTGVPLLPSGNDINSYVVGGELVVPITKKVKFSGEIAYGQALDVEFFRYAQSLNLTHRAAGSHHGWLGAAELRPFIRLYVPRRLWLR